MIQDEHKLEHFDSYNGINFINDSKSTNVNSTWYALESIPKPIIWIAGGIDKGNAYEPLIELVKSKVKCLICIGRDNSNLLKLFSNNVDYIVEVDSMDKAVFEAVKIASKGDNVLLSPACASFDVFDNFEQRGNEFKKSVYKRPSGFDIIFDLHYTESKSNTSIIQVCNNINIELFQKIHENPSLLKEFRSHRFEELFAEMLRQFNYEVQLTKKTRDGGKDIIAISHEFLNLKYIVECKTSKNKIGIVPVHRLHNVKTREQATKAIFATTSTFTKDALSYFKEYKYELEPLDFDAIMEWINKLVINNNTIPNNVYTQWPK